jgi:DNA-directed RNA polymerase subunit omega
VRAKVGATLVSCRKSESIMKADLIQAASEVITNPQILVNMVSRRVRQLSLGHRPLVEYAPGLGGADIALTEIANRKLTFESTFGQNGTAEAPARVVLFPGVASSKNVKKAA